MHDMKTMREKVKSLNVLVVEDEAEILNSSLQFMRKFFQSVDGAENGEIAMKIFKDKGSYDVVITDIQMPKISGWELIRSIRAIDTEVYIAAMTGSPESGADELIRLCDSYLKKPLSIDAMVQMLEQIIKNRWMS